VQKLTAAYAWYVKKHVTCMTEQYCHLLTYNHLLAPWPTSWATFSYLSPWVDLNKCVA